MAGPMGRFRYVSDDGTNYVIKLDQSNAALTGAVAADGTEVNPPKGFRPRYVLAQLPSGRQRRLVVTTVTSGAWTGAETSVALPDFSNLMAPLTAQLRGRVGERRYARG